MCKDAIDLRARIRRVETLARSLRRTPYLARLMLDATDMRYLIIVLPLMLSSCGAPEMRLVTYPPDFIYIERRELNTVMWQLAASVAALQRALGDAPTSDIDLDAARAALSELDVAASKLPIAATTNHPMLGERAGRFRRDVRLALEHIEGADPSLARSVTGACLYCHGTGER